LRDIIDTLYKQWNRHQAAQDTSKYPDLASASVPGEGGGGGKVFG